jgi:hypothetical protein
MRCPQLKAPVLKKTGDQGSGVVGRAQRKVVCHAFVIIFPIVKDVTKYEQKSPAYGTLQDGIFRDRIVLRCSLYSVDLSVGIAFFSRF